MVYKLGHKHTEETKAKIAQGHFGVVPWNKGKHTKPGYLSPKDYAALLESQGGVCAICRKEETQISNKTYGKVDRLRVDHDHKTGKIRGLLCSRCNFAIGHFQDNFDNIVMALDYMFEYANFSSAKEGMI